MELECEHCGAAVGDDDPMSFCDYCGEPTCPNCARAGLEAHDHCASDGGDV